MQVQVDAIISLAKYFATFRNCPLNKQMRCSGAAYSKTRVYSL